MAPYSGIPSLRQQITLALVPKFTAALSILGSSYIIVDVVSKRRRQKTQSNTNMQQMQTYHRLLIGLSISDLIMSIGLFTSTWPMPVDTPHVYGAVGNTQTCALVGFMETVGVAAVMYNASLSFYYLLRIRHGWSVSRIQKQTKVEVLMHVIPIVFALFTMIAGLFDCWIAPFPQGCTESWRFQRSSGSTDSEEDINSNPCIRGDNASLYQWVFDLIPKWTCILLVTINMILVHQAVWKQERSTLRRTFRAYAHTAGTVPTTNAHDSTCSSNTRPFASMTNTNAGAGAGAAAAAAATESNRHVNNATTTTRTPTTRTLRRSATGNRVVAHNAPFSARLSRRLARQSYLYVGALYITYVPVIITRAFELTHGYVHYEMLLTISITIPLQGFWNVLVYLRPRYLAKQDERRRQQQRQEHLLSAARQQRMSTLQQSSSNNRTAAAEGSATAAEGTTSTNHLRMFLQTVSQVVQEGGLENEEQEAEAEADADDENDNEQQEANNNDTMVNNVNNNNNNNNTEQGESLAGGAATVLAAPAATTTEVVNHHHDDGKPSNSAHTKEPPPPPPPPSPLSSDTVRIPTSSNREKPE